MSGATISNSTKATKTSETTPKIKALVDAKTKEFQHFSFLKHPFSLLVAPHKKDFLQELILDKTLILLNKKKNFIVAYTLAKNSKIKFIHPSRSDSKRNWRLLSPRLRPHPSLPTTGKTSTRALPIVLNNARLFLSKQKTLRWKWQQKNYSEHSLSTFTASSKLWPNTKSALWLTLPTSTTLRITVAIKSSLPYYRETSLLPLQCQRPDKLLTKQK